ncbi:hypothetical protein [Candidatus Hakubella thermalkaliphila]|nr:hypothetical protein [Candidatus Hakubella thermalkaliphila]
MSFHRGSVPYPSAVQRKIKESPMHRGAPRRMKIMLFSREGQAG